MDGKRVCHVCGAEADPDATYCRSCGAYVQGGPPRDPVFGQKSPVLAAILSLIWPGLGLLGAGVMMVWYVYVNNAYTLAQ